MTRGKILTQAKILWIQATHATHAKILTYATHTKIFIKKWLNSKTFKPTPFFDPQQNFDPSQKFMDPGHPRNPRQNFDLRHPHQNILNASYPPHLRHLLQNFNHVTHAKIF